MKKYFLFYLVILSSILIAEENWTHNDYFEDYEGTKTCLESATKGRRNLFFIHNTINGKGLHQIL